MAMLYCHRWMPAMSTPDPIPSWILRHPALSPYIHPLAAPNPLNRQGAFRGVAAEVSASAEELTATLRHQLVSQPDTAAECVAHLSKLGAPVEPLQEVRRASSRGWRGRLQDHALLLADDGRSGVEQLLHAVPALPPCQAYMDCKRQRLEATLAACGLMLKRLAVAAGLLEAGAEGAPDPALRARLEQLFPDSGQGGAALPSLRQVITTLNRCVGGGAMAEVEHVRGGGRRPACCCQSGSSPSYPCISSNLPVCCTYLCSAFMTELTQTAALYCELFGADGRPRLVRAARDVLARYLKLVRRALCDASAVAAAAAAGITTAGQLAGLLSPLLEPGTAAGGWAAGRHPGVEASLAPDWGAATLLEGLYVVRADLARLQGLLPELSPGDKAHEVVTNALRQHLALCFAALERRLLSTADGLRAALVALPANGEAKRAAMVAGLAVLQAVLAQGTERLLTRWGEGVGRPARCPGAVARVPALACNGTGGT